LVADDLRQRIVDGDLQDGDRLPRQEDLLGEFGISKPSLREALRILETEGLISVRRGKVGGAVVHTPTTDNAAYALGMVLRSDKVGDADVAIALDTIEPQCVGMCAARPDRLTVVVPGLWEAHAEAVEAIDDPRELAARSNIFHDRIVFGCGNQTLILLVGALRAVHSDFIDAWLEGHTPTLEVRRQALDEHARLIALVESGDTEAATEAARRHLQWSAVDAPVRASRKP
jgi:GntR family transcriptional repressor for pyruvate dehydrogenase complex